MLGNGDIIGNQVKRDKWPFTYEGLDWGGGGGGLVFTIH